MSGISRMMGNLHGMCRLGVGNREGRKAGENRKLERVSMKVKMRMCCKF